MSQIDKIRQKTIDFHKWDTVIYKQCVPLYNPKLYPHTKFGIPTVNNIDVPEVKFKVTPTSTGHSGTLTCIHNLNLGFHTLKQYKIYALDTIFLELGSENKVKIIVTPETVCDTLQTQGVSTH